jgi:hypothetical protein
MIALDTVSFHHETVKGCRKQCGDFGLLLPKSEPQPVDLGLFLRQFGDICAAYAGFSVLLPSKRRGDLIYTLDSFLPPTTPNAPFRSLHRLLIGSNITILKNTISMPPKTLPSFASVISSGHESPGLPDYYRTTRREEYGPYHREPDHPQDLMVCISANKATSWIT